MMRKKITSLQHPFIKYLVNLRKDKQLRKQEQLVLVTGDKLIFELLAQHRGVSHLFSLSESIIHPSIDQTQITKEILHKISGVHSEETLAALVRIPQTKDIFQKNKIVICDGISDPGNLGTILRSAWALGWDGAFITEKSCDPFNDKALRAAKGATFSLPLQEGSFADVMKKKNRFTIYLAHMDGNDITDLPDIAHPTALILSNESLGVRQEAYNQFSRIKIPMIAGVESLNVASAGAILLHALRNGPHGS